MKREILVVVIALMSFIVLSSLYFSFRKGFEVGYENGFESREGKTCECYGAKTTLNISNDSFTVSFSKNMSAGVHRFFIVSEENGALTLYIDATRQFRIPYLEAGRYYNMSSYGMEDE